MNNCQRLTYFVKDSKESYDHLCAQEAPWNGLSIPYPLSIFESLWRVVLFSALSERDPELNSCDLSEWHLGASSSTIDKPKRYKLEIKHSSTYSCQ